jgi:hypothetical protein
MLDISLLDTLAACFADAIQREFPEWRSQLELVETCEVRLLVPQPGSDRSLEVRAGHGEISLSYGEWTFMIGTFLYETEETTVEWAMYIVRGIVSDELRARITHKDGVWIECGLGQAFFPIEAKPGEVVTAYSWRGTHDATVHG